MKNALLVGMGAAAILAGTGVEAATCTATFGGQDDLCAATQLVNFNATVSDSDTAESIFLGGREGISVSRFDPSLGTLIGAEVVVDGNYQLSLSGDPLTVDVEFDAKPTSLSGTFETLSPLFQVLVPDSVAGTFSGTLNYMGNAAVSSFQSPTNPSFLIDLNVRHFSSSPVTVSVDGRYFGSVELTYFYEGDMAPVPLPASGLILLTGLSSLGLWRLRAVA